MAFERNRELTLLIAAVGITRFTFRSHALYDIDSVNFALAINHFSPAAYQPHPPGYFLYVLLAKLVNLLFQDPNTSLVSLSIAASCGAAWAIHKLAAEWFGRRAATFAGLIFLCSPLAWFHGTVALTYMIEAFFSAVLGLLFWRVRNGGPVSVAAITLGIAAGIRPSTLLFLGPLFLYSLLCQKSLRQKSNARVRALLLLTVTILAWAIPMIQSSGGWGVYSGALWTLWTLVPAQQTVVNSSLVNSLVRAITIAYIGLLAFGSVAIIWILALLSRISHRDGASQASLTPSQLRNFIAVWLLPGLLFFTFVFLKFVNAGYLLVLFPPLCAWLGLRASRWYGQTTWYNQTAGAVPLKVFLLSAAMAFNTAIFLFAPVYCSYRGVREFERELGQIRAELPKAVSPSDTLIVGFDSHTLGYRHAGYYLGNYSTVQYPEVLLPSTKKAAAKQVFSMAHQDTWLADDLGTGRYRQFVLFPLPNAAQYNEFLAPLLTKLPAEDRKTIRIGQHDYSTWPIRDLAILFPTTTSPCIGGVNSVASVYIR